METPEYRFRQECPKCGNPATDKKFISAEGVKAEYLDCGCALCGFKCTMQTSEDMFKDMKCLSLKLEEAKNAAKKWNEKT